MAKKNKADAIKENILNRRPAMGENYRNIFSERQEDLDLIKQQQEFRRSGIRGKEAAEIDYQYMRMVSNVRDDFTYQDHPDLMELAYSIAINGLESAVEVFPENDNTFTLHHGHRRYLAIKYIMENDTIQQTDKNEMLTITDDMRDNVRFVPSLLLLDKPDEYKRLKSQMHDNKGRRELTSLELASLVGRLIDSGERSGDVAREFGYNKGAVSELYKINSIESSIKQKLREIEKYGYTVRFLKQTVSDDLGPNRDKSLARQTFASSGDDIDLGPNRDKSLACQTFPYLQASSISRKDLRKVAYGKRSKNDQNWQQNEVFWFIFAKKCTSDDAKDIGLDIESLLGKVNKPSQLELFASDIVKLTKQLNKRLRSVEELAEFDSVRSWATVEDAMASIRTLTTEMTVLYDRFEEIKKARKVGDSTVLSTSVHSTSNNTTNNNSVYHLKMTFKGKDFDFTEDVLAYGLGKVLFGIIDLVFYNAVRVSAGKKKEIPKNPFTVLKNNLSDKKWVSHMPDEFDDEKGLIMPGLIRYVEDGCLNIREFFIPTTDPRPGVKPWELDIKEIPLGKYGEKAIRLLGRLFFEKMERVAGV
ncbi:hypothetical protein [Acinetobacter sp.]|uniref:hypothetical protein n=1 Tax=Acinetobacter sp. TaxID=472 RepID=UPI003CFFD5EE